MRNRFITGTCYQPVNDDEFGLRAGGSAQVFQYGEAILISPVVEYLTNDEDGYILLLRRLWFKEVMALVIKCR
jgi:hypothetical protein